MNTLFLNQFTDDQIKMIISRSCELLCERRRHRLHMEVYDKFWHHKLGVRIAEFPPVVKQERERSWNCRRCFAVVRGPKPQQFQFHFTPAIETDYSGCRQATDADIAITKLSLDRGKVVGGGKFKFRSHDTGEIYFDGFPPELLIPIVDQLTEQAELRQLYIDCFGYQFWDKPVIWERLYREACERISLNPIGRDALLDLLPFVPDYHKRNLERFANRA